MCSEKLTDHVILMQVNGALGNGPEEEDNKHISGKKVLAVADDESLRALHSIVSTRKGCKVKCVMYKNWDGRLYHLQCVQLLRKASLSQSKIFLDDPYKYILMIMYN